MRGHEPQPDQAIEPVWFTAAGCSVCPGLRIYNDFESIGLGLSSGDQDCRDQPSPTRSVKTSYRKQVIILLSISVFLLLAILVSQTAFDLNFLHPGNNQEIVVFAALSALIFLLFVALTFVLMRNLLKLFAERRLGVLGAKFRTRMVAGALASVLSAGHDDVLVRLWTDESLHR